MAYKLDKDLERYFKDIKKATRFSRLFRLPRIGYRCYIKHQGQKDKTYIEFVGCGDDTCAYETEKCTSSIWNYFDELREEIEYQFENEIQCGMIEYVKIEPCLCYIDPWWKKYDKTWFGHIKSCINNVLGFRMSEYKSTKNWSIKEFGKWKTFWKNPIWDLILPHRWIKNWFGRILYIKKKSVLKKENI